MPPPSYRTPFSTQNSTLTIAGSLWLEAEEAKIALASRTRLSDPSLVAFFPDYLTLLQTLLDVSTRDAVSEVAEIDLSTDEDSPQSIASLATKKGLITLAGISSSVKDQQAGKNEHLRSFDVEFPPRKRTKTENSSVSDKTTAIIAPFGKGSLLSPPTPKNPRTYQRIIRLSPVKSREVASKRIGAIATADAASHEIVLFDATIFLPTSASVLQRLHLDSEAEDLDLAEYSEASFGLVFCTNYEVYLYDLKCDFLKKTSVPSYPDAIAIHSIPKVGDIPRPKIRCVRWLSDKHLAVLQNRQSSGPELILLEVEAGKKTAHIVQGKVLPKSMGIGIRLAICQLDADPASGDRQIVIAVAGQNKTIHILTLNHQPLEEERTKRLTPLTNFTVLDTSDQHPQSISKIAFSNFFPPIQPAGSTMSVASGTQYIHLASVSLGYTVSVEALALTSTPTVPSSTSKDPVANEKTTNRPSVRWVLSTRHGEFLQSWFGIYVAAFAILVVALLFQSFKATSPSLSRGLKPTSGLLSSFDASSSSNNIIASISSGAATVGSAASSLTSTASAIAYSASSEAENKLVDLLQLHEEHLSGENPSKAILMRAPENPFAESKLAAELHHDAEQAREKGAKKFEELSEPEKKRWLKRLSDAGHWSEDQGVTILKSVLFAEYAQIVGGALRDAVLN